MKTEELTDITTYILRCTTLICICSTGMFWWIALVTLRSYQCYSNLYRICRTRFENRKPAHLRRMFRETFSRPEAKKKIQNHLRSFCRWERVRKLSISQTCTGRAPATCISTSSDNSSGRSARDSTFVCQTPISHYLQRITLTFSNFSSSFDCLYHLSAMFLDRTSTFSKNCFRKNYSLFTLCKVQSSLGYTIPSPLSLQLWWQLANSPVVVALDVKIHRLQF